MLQCASSSVYLYIYIYIYIVGSIFKHILLLVFRSHCCISIGIPTCRILCVVLLLSSSFSWYLSRFLPFGASYLNRHVPVVFAALPRRTVWAPCRAINHSMMAYRLQIKFAWRWGWVLLGCSWAVERITGPFLVICGSS